MERFKTRYFKHLIALGILIYIGLYVYAAALYPGGSQNNPESIGFDWRHNYWCNLMNEKAMNGVLNPARTYAIFAWLILCLSINLFAIRLALIAAPSTFWRKLIMVSGTLTMLIASALFTPLHDTITIVSSVFGIVFFIGLTNTIFRGKKLVLICGYLIAVALLLINNVIYYTTVFLDYLPLIQKISFAWVLIFILYTNYSLENRRV